MSTFSMAVDYLARSTTLTDVPWPWYIAIGGIAGWIASIIMGTGKQMGLLLNIVVGVAGALLGGFLLSFYYETADGGKWFTFFAALLGSIILLFLIKLVKKRN